MSGVNLSIDDFGTGQSSLARLQRLPVNQVKLDRSFLASIDEDSHTATLVRSMIELGQALGLQMVAKGIERDSQHAILRDAARRIDQSASDALGQCYLFARPQTADDISALLDRAASRRWRSERASAAEQTAGQRDHAGRIAAGGPVAVLGDRHQDGDKRPQAQDQADDQQHQRLRIGAEELRQRTHRQHDGDKMP